VRGVDGPPLFDRPLAVDEAVDVVEGWVTAPAAEYLHPGPRHLHVLTQLLRTSGAAGNLTNDAPLAALAIEHRARVVTFDADVDRFPGVRWERPAADPSGRGRQ
jgi:predicted nucleic acid-binding protein